MLSDDELAEIAYAEMMRGRVGAELGWIFRAPDEQVRWIGIARAIRTALTGPVTPLAPGDYVDIGASLRAFHDVEDGDFGVMVWDDDDRGARFVDERIAYLDAAGVRALRTACQRFLAAQEGE